MFEDTEHPVGLALFAPDATSDVRVWRNNQFLGTIKELRRHLPQPSSNRDIVFNDPQGKPRTHRHRQYRFPLYPFLSGRRIERLSDPGPLPFHYEDWRAVARGY